MHTLEIQAKHKKAVRVDGREYIVDFPLPIVANLEVALGRSMKFPTDWVAIKVGEVHAILTAGLLTHHPEEAERVSKEVCSVDPEDIETVIDFLCTVACPKAMKRWEERLEKLRKGKQALPNAPGGDVL